MSDALRQMVDLEADRADTWKARAERAEAWHWKAAALLAELRRTGIIANTVDGEMSSAYAKRADELLAEWCE